MSHTLMIGGREAGCEGEVPGDPADRKLRPSWASSSWKATTTSQMPLKGSPELTCGGRAFPRSPQQGASAGRGGGGPATAPSGSCPGREWANRFCRWQLSTCKLEHIVPPVSWTAAFTSSSVCDQKLTNVYVGVKSFMRPQA